MTSHSVSGSSRAAIVSTCGAPNDCVYPITTSVLLHALRFYSSAPYECAARPTQLRRHRVIGCHE
jgi:hypothetical protein